MLRKALSFVVVAFAFSIGLGNSSHAQTYPTHAINIVVPYNPGGMPDVMARIVGQKLAENVGQPVVIENKPGGAGIIGAQYFLSRALPDGYTIFLLDNNTAAINAAVYPDLPYDPARDFIPVAQAVEGYVYLVANAKAGISTLDELVASARKNPGKLNYASPGTATLHHLGMEQLALMAGIKLVHVPYRGTAQATTDLLRGDVAFMFATLASVSQHVEEGSLRLIAVGAPKRSALTPDVPTLDELGLKGFLAGTTMGFAVKAGTPPEIVSKLNAEINKALKAPNVIAGIDVLGVRPINTSPEQFGNQLAVDRTMYLKLVKDINFKLN
ncbi:tripartite tricarboxylate transporter substrate binding protein [Roseiarcaceae bacterium H3SJ34-1]|uniref:Bug family tripartite tricarboxylate transporter substrate binding protein n=1 Tax=Terripilifer ovatus TaxID=3032367 RepID=UPI003AB91E70|nr:tripartite tricarboxylate transporter substrate binding protein [Roseiarcaceae bacterium H3SJ34-1]